MSAQRTGTPTGTPKINMGTAREIRRLYRECTWITQKELAKQFGLSRQSVNRIIKGMIWFDKGQPDDTEAANSRRLTPTDEASIRTLYSEGVSQTEISERFSIAQCTVSRVLSRVAKVDK